MPDISMCKNTTCPLRKECYRFTAIPTPYRQSYAFFKPENVKGKVTCTYQMKIYNNKEDESNRT